jgi:hypothetical protein
MQTLNSTAVTILQTVIKYGQDVVLPSQKRQIDAMYALKALGLVGVHPTTSGGVEVFLVRLPESTQITVTQ